MFIYLLSIFINHGLLVFGRGLEKLLSPINDLKTDSILESISRIRQKIRPGRHEPRQSKKQLINRGAAVCWHLGITNNNKQ
ncbi:MAG: hypothetical protein Q8R83_05755 [Legionellaceae bacterium]|nr:hypothetical protein [Legionellaceae bacterium]